jgi:cellulose biosynthesis protein BcsQ
MFNTRHSYNSVPNVPNVPNVPPVPAHQFGEFINETYKDKAYKTVIRLNVALSDAQMQGKSVFETDAKSRGAEDYLSVCKEILNDWF